METKLILISTVIILPMLMLANTTNDKVQQLMKKNIYIETTLADNTAKSILSEVGDKSSLRVERGVAQVASLWRNEDGSPEEFSVFCKKHFINNKKELEIFYGKLERNFEIINGFFHRFHYILHFNC